MPRASCVIFLDLLLSGGRIYICHRCLAVFFSATDFFGLILSINFSQVITFIEVLISIELRKRTN